MLDGFFVFYCNFVTFTCWNKKTYIVSTQVLYFVRIHKPKYLRSCQATSYRHFSLAIQLIVNLTCQKKLLQKNPRQYQKMEREID
jgi:hypothetical protein